MELLRSLYHRLVHLAGKAITVVDYALEGTYTRAALSAVWDLFSTLWYFVLIGAFLAVCVSRFVPKQRVAHLLENRRDSAIVGCSLLGVLSPMSAFSAIPKVGGLLAPWACRRRPSWPFWWRRP